MKTARRILFLCFCLCLAASGVMLTLAYTQTGQPTILYDGQEKSILFLNTQGTDLFTNLKDLMPGDTRVQEISLQAQNLSGPATLYLRADCTEETAEKLKNLMLSVYAGDRLISSGPAGGDSALSSGVELYQFTENQIVPLRVELKIPVEVGNELAGAQEQLQWIFTVQEDSGEIVVPPNTGNAVVFWPWWLLCGISAGGLVVMGLLGKKKKTPKEK